MTLTELFATDDYKRQNETFGAADVPYLYTYDEFDRSSVEFEEWPYPMVNGYDIGPDGLVYLLCRNVWKVGPYKTGSAVFVFEIRDEAKDDE